MFSLPLLPLVELVGSIDWTCLNYVKKKLVSLLCLLCLLWHGELWTTGPLSIASKILFVHGKEDNRFLSSIPSNKREGIVFFVFSSVGKIVVWGVKQSGQILTEDQIGKPDPLSRTFLSTTGSPHYIFRSELNIKSKISGSTKVLLQRIVRKTIVCWLALGAYYCIGVEHNVWWFAYVFLIMGIFYKLCSFYFEFH